LKAKHPFIIVRQRKHFTTYLVPLYAQHKVTSKPKGDCILMLIHGHHVCPRACTYLRYSNFHADKE